MLKTGVCGRSNTEASKTGSGAEPGLKLSILTIILMILMIMMIMVLIMMMNMMMAMSTRRAGVEEKLQPCHPDSKFRTRNWASCPDHDDDDDCYHFYDD